MISQTSFSSVAQQFDLFFEQITTFIYDHPTFSKEVIAEKERYFSKTGKVLPDHENYSNRMNSFLSWYIFDCHSTINNWSPLKHYIEELKKNGNDQEQLKFLEGQQPHIHSLFEFLKADRNGDALVRDLVTRKKHLVSVKENLVGFNKGGCFETRIFIFQKGNCFANFFIHHPIEVRKGINKQVKELCNRRGPVLPFLLQLHSFHSKWVKYRNIDIKSIYYFDKSLPEAK